MWKLLHTKVYQCDLSLWKQGLQQIHRGGTGSTQSSPQIFLQLYYECFSQKRQILSVWKSNTCQDHNSYIGPNQQDLTAQFFVSNWPLAGAEARVKQGKQLCHFFLVGMGLENSSFLIYFRGKKLNITERHQNM